MQRIKLYSRISTNLTCLSNEKLKQILAESKPMREGIGGKSVLISIDDKPVFGVLSDKTHLRVKFL